MENRVDTKMLNTIKQRIKNLHVDALTMNQESLAECLYPYKWYNPFPKFRFSERPDTAAASILEGNVVIFVDNSPAAMILPSSIFDIIEEADDYYFPPITGTYLRLSRMVISILTLYLTPAWLLLMQNPDMIPPWLEFIKLSAPFLCSADLTAALTGICHRWSAAGCCQHPKYADYSSQCHRRYCHGRIFR